ncbi:hypothetical protein AVEN_58927-1 [Araneus ventricosus]|uniref:Retroviral polymerase SH3-like domain-containing protein n=1 Tax=Araneus ventricosus TaxID=182803 RepID=A0A4Y2EPE8_ARAVE|nr:hypothetical protein AVEN_58927-1 [Araneus ventricosus]
MRAKLGIMMGYALYTKGYRIWLRDENKLIETINLRFDENTKGIDARQNSNQSNKFNFIISNYSDDEDDFDTVIDSLSGRLIPETSSESPSTSREEPTASTDSSLIPCSEIKSNLKPSEEPCMNEHFLGSIPVGDVLIKKQLEEMKASLKNMHNWANMKGKDPGVQMES